MAYDCILFGKSSLMHIALAMFRICLAIFDHRLKTKPVYKVNRESKAEVKYVSECRKFSYCYGLCFPDIWVAGYSTQVSLVILVISISSVSIDMFFFFLHKSQYVSISRMTCIYLLCKFLRVKREKLSKTLSKRIHWLEVVRGCLEM